MKSTIRLILAAVLGSSLTFGAVYWLQGSGKTITIKHMDSTPVHGVVYSKNGSGEFVPLSFVDAAEEVMESVVHIRSTRVMSASHSYQNRQLPDPFRDFFGEDMFERFHGPQQSPDPKKREFRNEGTGSGVIINENGYIVTNNHVIDHADEIEVTLHDNRSYPATVIGTDPATDLALIQIKANGLKQIPMVNSDDVKVGEWVMAVGNPFNLNSTVTAGIVSAKARNINILKDKYAIESFIQTDAAINPGNSGGALVNLQGGLVGINTAISSPTGTYAGYGFAVPSNMVGKIVEDLLKYGRVQRGFLGVSIRNIDALLTKEKELKISNGVYIDSVSEGSSAEDAGIKSGDVIVAVDGIKVDAAPELQELIARHRPGDKIDIKVNRFGKEKFFSVTLKNREGKTDVSRKEYANTLMSLGADFKSLSKKEADQLGIQGGVKIVQLYPGKLKRETDIREGFVITKVDKQSVKDLEDLEDLLQGKKGGVLLEGLYDKDSGTMYYGLGM